MENMRLKCKTMARATKASTSTKPTNVQVAITSRNKFTNVRDSTKHTQVLSDADYVPQTGLTVAKMVVK